MRSRIWVIRFITLMVAFLFAINGVYAAKNVLIITGDNNHKSWEQCTPKLVKFLESEKKFSVKVCTNVADLKPQDLEGVDLIVSNWNSYGKDSLAKDAKWSKEFRKAFEDSIKDGCGFVAVHAGTASYFEDWENWKKISLGTFIKGKTFHKRRGSFEIKKGVDHPVNKGIDDLTSEKDELWNNIVITNPEAVVVFYAVTDKENIGLKKPQVSALAGNFGKGKCFVTYLGHDAEAMGDTFKKIFLSACNWAVR